MIVGQLTEKLLQGSSEGPSRRGNRGNIDRNRDRNRSRNRNRAHETQQNNDNKNRNKSKRQNRKGYEYARYQEMYRVCPKRLIDMAVAGKTLNTVRPSKPPKKKK